MSARTFAWAKAPLAAIAAIGLGVLAAACEPGPKQTQQSGYRGTGMAQVYEPELLAYLREANAIPAPPFELSGTPDASVGELGLYENVQVLGDLTGEEFNHLMAAITEWIVPQAYRDDPDNAGGCNYCHNPQNMASDEVYTKLVARSMLRMTREVNAEWQPHVKGTGVTCYTCHRGQPVPAAAWALSPEPQARWSNGRGEQNTPAPTVGFASLPYDIFAPYVADPAHTTIRVQSGQALPTSAGGPPIQAAEGTYGLMMHMSTSLGVNCTYCHNSRAFGSWASSPPQRVTAWHGLAMVRQINASWIIPLEPVFPANRLGPLGDPYKVQCATCHRGLPKPLNGVSMLPDYPSLARNPAPIPARAAPAAAANSEEPL